MERVKHSISENIRLCAFADEASSTLKEQINALKRNQISLIEIRNVDGQNVADFSLLKAKEIKKAFDSENIKVFSIGSPIGKVKIDDNFDEHLKKLEHILNIAQIFDCNKMRIFSFFTSNYALDREKVIERLNKMTLIATKAGVGLYHENEKDIYGDSVERVIDLLDNVKGLRSVFDPANFVQCGENVSKALDVLFSRSDYFHIKDAIKETGELVPAGEGDGEIGKLLSLIKRETVLTLEPHLAIFDGYKNIDNHEMKNKYTFKTNLEAFDFATNSLKKLIADMSC